MKAILMSIQPKWCNLIANGNKTIEVRKTKPKIEPPFKVYIYCTKNDGTLYYLGKTDNMFDTPKQWNGKVIGEYVCDKVDEYTFSNYEAEYRITDVELMATCLDHPILINYGKGNPLYGLHISQLKIYDEPKELSDFWTIKCANKKGGCSDCDIKPGCIKHITRPPQSWCYVEEQDDDKE